MKKTIGGDRLGSGKKMKVDLRTYERSTHDMGYTWRSTMAAGTLVPFLKEVALPGDTFDIELDCNVLTHPTVGPLFGSFKVQLDIFQCPIRLYQRLLHNNELGIGLKMGTVLLPQLMVEAEVTANSLKEADNDQINPSCILSYLDMRGVGRSTRTTGTVVRRFNAIPLIAYWDIYKNYYANKQEEIGAVLHNQTPAFPKTITGVTTQNPTGTIPMDPGRSNVQLLSTAGMTITHATSVPPDLNTVIIGVQTFDGVGTIEYKANELFNQRNNTTTTINLLSPKEWLIGRRIYYWRYIDGNDITKNMPLVETFPLKNIDEMRTNILTKSGESALVITEGSIKPYSLVLNKQGEVWSKKTSQEGLALKTYQSDINNNWISKEWIDGQNGIAEVTAVAVTDGKVKLDALILGRKVYDMLNRIAISGGSYDDWLDTVYTHERARRVQSPIYEGGLIKELIFQEVISNAESGTGGSEQPLGTLAGKGAMSGKHKGGKITVNVDEPSYIMGIVSLTPRIDYSQGNKWDTNLKTMDDLHKPGLDGIGFQDLITDTMAWWDTVYDEGTIKFKTAGKQPAWINYMTNVNVVRGNFAEVDNEMFMTLNRRYERSTTGEIKDLTTYIDPAKFNHIFAMTSRDSQNFWTQIRVDMTARRKMSAKIIPNL